LAAQLASDTTGGWQWRRSEFMAGAWWQLLTSQWVHFNAAHAGTNIAAMALMLLAFDRLVDRPLQLSAMLGGYVGVAIVLASDPSCSDYAGASGALHGFLAGNALALVATQPGRTRTPIHPRSLGLAVLLALAAKLLIQHDWGGPSAPNWLGFSTYTPAHEAGAAAGLLAAALVLTVRRRRLGHP
jgi:rhomboid family GlyGly-CTERM serine protease